MIAGGMSAGGVNGGVAPTRSVEQFAVRGDTRVFGAGVDGENDLSSVSRYGQTRYFPLVGRHPFVDE